MLRLKGKVVRGELEGDVIRFDVGQICGISRDGIGTLVRFTEQDEVFVIDPASIQPADDPRKAMIDEIRTRMYQEFDSNEHRFVHEVMATILDEMEAKL